MFITAPRLNIFSQFFSPEFYQSQDRFDIKPQQEIMLIFDDNDIIYAYRACCDIMSPHSERQLCVVIKNFSWTSHINVPVGLKLTSLLSLPSIQSRLCIARVIDIDDENMDNDSGAGDDDDDDEAESDGENDEDKCTPPSPEDEDNKENIHPTKVLSITKDKQFYVTL